MKQEISQRFDRNIARVRNLVSIYQTQLAGAGRGRRGHQQTDVLRAAAVLLHAALEDVLRSLAYWKLPTAQAAALDQYPIAGGPAMKVSLGALAAHRGKTVDQLIKMSIDASLERSNYNNPGEVSTLLQSIGINTAPLAPYMGQLDLAMKRRHRIVHRADENPNAGRGNHQVASISPPLLNAWIDNTVAFVRDVLQQV